MLYFNTGLMISEKIKAQKWGAKVLDQISADLQKGLPELKGFSAGNLKKIKLFAEAYAPHLVIGSTASNQFGLASIGEGFSISSTLSNLIENKAFYEAFTSISFSLSFYNYHQNKGLGSLGFLHSVCSDQFLVADGVGTSNFKRPVWKGR